MSSDNLVEVKKDSMKNNPTTFQLPHINSEPPIMIKVILIQVNSVVCMMLEMIEMIRDNIAARRIIVHIQSLAHKKFLYGI